MDLRGNSFVRERDFSTFPRARERDASLRGMRSCGSGISNTSRDRGTIPNPVQNRGINPEECPGKYGVRAVHVGCSAGAKPR